MKKGLSLSRLNFWLLMIIVFRSRESQFRRMIAKRVYRRFTGTDRQNALARAVSFCSSKPRLGMSNSLSLSRALVQASFRVRCKRADRTGPGFAGTGKSHRSVLSLRTRRTVARWKRAERRFARTCVVNKP